jgi:chorismate mutase
MTTTPTSTPTTPTALVTPANPVAAPVPALAPAAVSTPASSQTSIRDESDPTPTTVGGSDSGSTIPNSSAPGVLGGRVRMDTIDEQIVELIRRRGEASRDIQAARIADGGRRVDLRRETEIIGRYTAALGRPGTAIAMALLELGRGRA